LVLERRGNGVDVVDLVVVRIVLGDGVRRGGRQGVVVGDIGSKATDELGRASLLVEVGEELSRRGKVGRPAKPSCVTSLYHPVSHNRGTKNI
jgi:hypothetical protein